MKNLFRPKQRGFGIGGLILGIALIGSVGLVAIRAMPAYSENMSVTTLVNQLENSTAEDVRAVRSEFDKQASVSYIESIKGSDLEINKVGGGWQISYEYEKRIPLVANISLVLEFSR